MSASRTQIVQTAIPTIVGDLGNDTSSVDRGVYLLTQTIAAHSGKLTNLCRTGCTNNTRCSSRRRSRRSREQHTRFFRAIRVSAPWSQDIPMATSALSYRGRGAPIRVTFGHVMLAALAVRARADSPSTTSNGGGFLRQFPTGASWPVQKYLHLESVASGGRSTTWARAPCRRPKPLAFRFGAGETMDGPTVTPRCLRSGGRPPLVLASYRRKTHRAHESFSNK